MNIYGIEAYNFLYMSMQYNLQLQHTTSLETVVIDCLSQFSFYIFFVHD